MPSVLQVREPSEGAVGSEAVAAPQSRRLGGGAGRPAAAPAEVAARAAHARRQAEAAAAHGDDVATAFERPVDEATALEEATLAAMGAVDAEAAAPEAGQVHDAADAPTNSTHSDAAEPTALGEGRAAEGCARPCDGGAGSGASDRKPVHLDAGQDRVSGSAEAMDADDAQVAPGGSAQSAALEAAATAASLQRSAAAAEDRDADNTSFDTSVTEASAARLREVRGILQSIASLQRSEEAQQARAALATIQQIMGNALREPQNEKFRRVRRANKLFAARVVPCPQVEMLMKLAGFALVDGTWSLGRRDDPAMLWLVHSLLQQAPQAAQS